MNWTGRNVLVTGANGFLGAHLVKRLVDARATVVCLIKHVTPLQPVPAGASAVPGDVENFDLLCSILKERQVDAVFHLAARPIVLEAQVDPLPTLETNVRGTYNLLEAARRWGKIRALVVATSDKVYGDSPHLPYRERQPLDGRGLYDTSKVCQDVLAQSYARNFKMPIGIARCGNLYGPGDVQWSRIIPGTIKSLLAGERPVIRGDGKSMRDYFYVEDAANAFMTLASSELRGQAYNFGTGHPTSTLEVVEALVARSGVDLPPVVLGGAQGEIHAQYLDCGKAADELGWHPRVGLDEGLDRTWAWYKKVLS